MRLHGSGNVPCTKGETGTVEKTTAVRVARCQSRRRLLTLGAALCSTAVPASAFSLGSARIGRFGAESRFTLTHLQSHFLGQRLPACRLGVAASSLRRIKSDSARSAVVPLRMGIPKLFRWLTDQYPAISKRLDQGLNEVRLISHVHLTSRMLF